MTEERLKEIKKEYLEIPLGKAKNLANQKFGKLYPLYRTENSTNHRGAYWVCECECGNITSVRGDSLQNGAIISCGCYQIERLRENNKKLIKNEIGNLYGYLTVISLNEEPEYTNNNGAMWNCQCKCGNTCVVSGRLLRRGETKSCGCYQIERLKEEIHPTLIKNEVGNIYGYLTVVSINKEIKYKNEYGAMWNCQCKCGNTCVVSGRHLRDGGTTSCGCRRSSKGEEKIKDILTKNNINFIQEYTPRDPNLSFNARFDFYIPLLNVLIEYDGEQHFRPVEHWGGENKFKETQERDAIKNQWCKDNNIPLIRIPYTHLKDLCLEDLQLETTKFLVNGD